METATLSTDPVAAAELSSYLLGSLTGMTKRRNSSPYPHPPSAFVRDLTQRGWRRCDAEALQLVKYCLEHTADSDRVPLLAGHAANALSKEPVLAGALMLFGRQEEARRPAGLLWRAAGDDCWPLAMLAATAGLHAAIRSIAESRQTAFDSGAKGN